MIFMWIGGQKISHAFLGNLIGVQIRDLDFFRLFFLADGKEI